MNAQTKNQKVRAGDFVVFHVGKNAYTVEVAGQVIARFRSLSKASAYACRCYRAISDEIGETRGRAD